NPLRVLDRLRLFDRLRQKRAPRRPPAVPQAHLHLEELEQKIAPSADLQGWWVVGPQTAQLGQTLTLNKVQVRNAGDTATGTFAQRFYLSRDAVGSSDDLPLTLSNGQAYYYHGGISAGGYGPQFSMGLQ